MNWFNICKRYIWFNAKKHFTYKIYFLSEILGNLVVPVLLNLFLWNALLKDNSVGYTLAQISQYIIISNLILMFTQVHLENTMQRDVKTYRLAQCILRPIGYIRHLVLNCISGSFVKLAYLYAPSFLITQIFIGSASNITFIWGIFSLLIAFSLNALISFVIGTLSFWLTEIWGIAALRNLLTGLFAGAFFPLDILSDDLQYVLMCLPFPHMSYVPAKILCGEMIEVQYYSQTLPIALVWIVIFLLLSYFLWNRGKQRYTSAGA